MALSHSPKIVTDGLVLCLDAADKKSYSGSGTTWTDRSGNGYNGSLTNGPTFDSSNGGSLVFDRVNDQIDCGDLDILGGASSATWELFLKPTEYTSSPSQWRSGITTWNDQQHTWAFDIRYRSYYLALRTTETTSYPGFYQGGSSVTHFPDNVWKHYIATYDGSNIKFYIDGELVATHSKTGDIAYKASSERLKVGADRTTTAPFGGNIAIARVYRNKALTAAEVAQNFQATRGRFGI